MATKPSIDYGLIEQALPVSGERTKEAAVTIALKEFVARRRQKGLLELMGQLEFFLRLQVGAGPAFKAPARGM